MVYLLSDASLGHIDYQRYVDDMVQWLVKEGAPELALKAQKTLLDVFVARSVHGRPILNEVVRQVEAKAKMISAAVSARAKASAAVPVETVAPKKRAAKKAKSKG
jgi:hypothetical protein